MVKESPECCNDWPAWELTYVLFIAFAPFYVLVIFYMLAAAGLLWSPIAAYTSARAARANGLNTRRYALAGAIHSILLILPWIYFWSELRNKPLKGVTIVTGYVLVCSLWLFGPISFWAILAFNGPQWESVLVFGMLALFVISILLVKCPKLRARQYNGTGANDYGLVSLISSPYLAPFVFAFITLAVTLIILGYSKITE